MMATLLAAGYTKKALATDCRTNPMEFEFWCVMGRAATSGLCVHCIIADSSASCGNCKSPGCSNNKQQGGA